MRAAAQIVARGAKRKTRGVSHHAAQLQHRGQLPLPLVTQLRQLSVTANKPVPTSGPAQGGVSQANVEKAKRRVEAREARVVVLEKQIALTKTALQTELRKTAANAVQYDIVLDNESRLATAMRAKLVKLEENLRLHKDLLALALSLLDATRSLVGMAPEETSEAKEERLKDLAERYKPALRENTTLVRTAYSGAEKAQAAVMPYIRGALGIGTADDDKMAWFRADGNNLVRIFAMVGQIGKGKTRLQYELCRQEAIKTDFGDTHVNFVRLTYDLSCFHAYPGDTMDVFGRNLLVCTGMGLADAMRVQSLEEAIELLYRKLTWPPGKARALVVCVDEVLLLPTGVLPTGGSDPDVARKNLLLELMRFQQESCEKEGANRVVFLFAAVTSEMLKGVQQGAQQEPGRELCAQDVPRLGNNDTLHMLYALRPDLRDRYENEPQFQQVVHICLSWPKALFDVLPTLYPKRTLQTTVPMSPALHKLAKSSNLLPALDHLAEDEVYSWLTSMTLHGDEERRLAQLRWGVTAAGGSLDPLTLQFWCEVWGSGRWKGIPDEKVLPVAHHLLAAYLADTQVQSFHKKDLETMLYNFEAAKRASYQRVFTLREYYKGGTIKGDLQVSVCAFPGAAPKDLVTTVASFRGTTAVVEHLEEGCVVISTLRNERGIKYLVPFFDPESKRLTHVAAVQVKYSSRKDLSGNYKDFFRAKVMERPIVKHLEQNNVTCFPVLFSTWPGDIAGEVEVGVLYNEAAMYEFTKCLGPLRFHLEDASADQVDRVRKPFC